MRYLGVVALFVAVVAGCAAPPGDDATRSEGAGSEGPDTETMTALEPSSVACPQVEGVDLPPECVPYDPQALMDSNEAYRDRLPVSADSFAAFEAQRADITAQIEALQTSGDLSAEAVTIILDGHGVQEATAGMTDGVVSFGGLGPLGGCVFGTATATEFDMELTGFVMDGGCVAVSGH